jgi:hypothetical protein
MEIKDNVVVIINQMGKMGLQQEKQYRQEL